MAARDDLLQQLRALPLEDREYIEAALLRDAATAGSRSNRPMTSRRSNDELSLH